MTQVFGTSLCEVLKFLRQELSFIKDNLFFQSEKPFLYLCNCSYSREISLYCPTTLPSFVSENIRVFSLKSGQYKSGDDILVIIFVLVFAVGNTLIFQCLYRLKKSVYCRRFLRQSTRTTFDWMVFQKQSVQWDVTFSHILRNILPLGIYF